MNLAIPPTIVQAKNSHGREQKKADQKNHLQTLLDGFVDLSGLEKHKPIFKGLSDNSKKVHEGFLFLASAGQSIVMDDQTKKWPQHGIVYAGEAVNRGATLIVWEPTEEVNEMPAVCEVKGKSDVPLIRVESLHEKIGEIASRFYQHPSHAMKVIGITGTNGKTSIAHFVAQTIQLMGHTCAVIGTLGNGLYGELEESSHTTPDAITLQALMADFRARQVDTIVMEVSSHALAQGRVNGVAFNSAIFSNLSRDHLDYHGDMENYADEKIKLFQFASLEHMIVNLDDDFSNKIVAIAKTKSEQNSDKLSTYSKQNNNADYFASDIVMDSHGLSFKLINKSQADMRYSVKSHLLGAFNIDNLLAMIAVVHQHGYPLDKITNAISQLNTVPGRMEKVGDAVKDDTLKQALIVIDYAHTPDALEKSLAALKLHTQGKLFCVFGCGGDRDTGKRPLMAKVAEQQADRVIVTTDNPRTEAAEQIITEIMAGFNHKEAIMIEVDREQAIINAIQQANSDDVVLIAGKGHENYQDIQGVKRPFSDKSCILSAIAQKQANTASDSESHC